MNIFYLDQNFNNCAKYHVDKHVVKMPIEYAQLLCSSHSMTGGNPPYKLSHAQHPCSIWIRQADNNYYWLLFLAQAICREYTHRYGKRHKSEDVIDWCSENIPDLPEAKLTAPPKCMPDEFKQKGVIRSYREYYIYGKQHIAKWTGRDRPEWYPSEIYKELK